MIPEGTLKVFTGDDDVTLFLRMNVTKLTSDNPTTEITDAKERELFYRRNNYNSRTNR